MPKTLFALTLLFFAAGLTFADGVTYTAMQIQPGPTISYASSINNSGQLTGEFAVGPASNPTYHPFIYTGGTFQYGTLGGTYSYGSAINNSGQVAGSSAGHAFIVMAACRI